MVALLAPRRHVGGLEILRSDAWIPDRYRDWQPRGELGRFVRQCVLDHLPADIAAELMERFSRIWVLSSALRGTVIRGDGRVEVLGLLSEHVITTAGVGFLVDAWQNLTELENLKYHGIGTGVGAEAVGDTALGTELTTQYNPDNTRATGTLTEGASANIFRTVGTNTLDSGTPAVTEHMILSQAATGGGTGWDRSVFTAINLNGANGDGLQTTYDLTASSGG
jgi:hypothetical protein